MMGKVLIIDFDGTIAKFENWPNMGEPEKGVKEALHKLKDMGYEIHIASCRTNHELKKYPIDRRDQVRAMERYLNDNEIPYDVVLDNDKALGVWYIDDKGIGFRGDWDKVVEEIEDNDAQYEK